MDRGRIGFVVGLRAEARLLRGSGFAVEIGGGDPAGAARAADRLIAKNIGALISFGLAGGLDPKLRPGAILIPETVIEDSDRYRCERYRCDAELLRMLGGANAQSILAASRIAATAEDKSQLFRRHMAGAVDLESGAVARAAAASNLPFAVLRAVTDPAERDLPPAALIALNSAGDIKISAVLASVFGDLGQIPALLAIAKDAGYARASLKRKLRQL